MAPKCPIPAKVAKRIASAWLGLFVQILGADGRAKAQFTCSGCLICVNGTWYWLTAGHCVEEVASLLAVGANDRVQLVFWSMPDFKDEARVMPYPASEFSPINFLAESRKHLSASPSEAETRRAELFDLAILRLPGASKCYLQNLGCEPFAEQELNFFAIADKRGEMDLKDTMVIGAREDAQKLGDIVPRVCLEFLPLRLFGSNNVIEEEGHTVWVEVRNAIGERAISTIGMSGGPVVAIGNDEYFLLGLQTHQRPINERGARPIGFLSTDFLFRDTSWLASVGTDSAIEEQ